MSTLLRVVTPFFSLRLRCPRSCPPRFEWVPWYPTLCGLTFARLFVRSRSGPSRMVAPAGVAPPLRPRLSFLTRFEVARPVVPLLRIGGVVLPLPVAGLR